MELSSLGIYVPEAYGMTGQADEAPAFQTLVNAVAAAGGGTVLMRPRTYNFNTKTIIPAGVVIIGAGIGDQYMTQGGTRIVTTTPNIELFELQGGLVQMEKLAIINGASGTPTAGCAIKTVKGTDIGAGGEYRSGYRFRDVGISNFYNLIDFVDAYLWEIDGCMLHAAHANALKVQNVALPDGGDSCISNSFFFGRMNNNEVGIRQLSSGGLKVTNCKFNGLAAYKGTMGVSSIFLFANNSVENFGAGNAIQIEGNYVNITGNQFSAYNGGAFFHVQANINGGNIVGNVFRGQGSERAVYLTAGQKVNVLNSYYGFTTTPVQVDAAATSIHILDV